MTDRPEYLVAIITNTGMMKFYISLSFLLWTRPYRRKTGWMLTFPLNYYAIDKNVPQRKYPVELEPRASQQLIISDIVTFRRVMRECILSQSELGRIAFRLVRATIQTVDGHFFRAKISKTIRDVNYGKFTKVLRVKKRFDSAAITDRRHPGSGAGVRPAPCAPGTDRSTIRAWPTAIRPHLPRHL